MPNTFLMRSMTLAACLSAFCIETTLAADTGPFIGNWALDREKSDFHGDAGYRSQTMVVTDAGSGMLHYAFDTVDSAGVASHAEYTTSHDGKRHPIADSTLFDSNHYQPLGKRRVKWTIFKGSTAIFWGVDTVSKDGKTEAESENWKQAGKVHTYHLVFDRQ